MSSKPNTAKSEALNTDLEVGYKGVTYRLKPAMLWSVEAMECLEEGRVVLGLRAILGGADSDQWTAFKSETGANMNDVVALFEAIKDATGGGLGK